MLPEDEVALIVDVLDRAQLRTPAALSCLHVPDAEAFSSLLVKLGCEVPRFGGSTPNPGLQIIPDGLRLALKKFYMLLSPQFPELLQRETSAYWGTTGVRTSSEPVDSARVDGLLSSSEGRIMTGLPPIPNSRKKRAAQGSLKKLEDGKKAHFVKLLIDEYYIALDRYRGISIRPPPGRTLDEWLRIVLGKGAWRSIRDLVCGWRRFRRWADREKISAIPPNIETIIMFLDSIVRTGSATSSTPASVRTSIQGVVLRFGFPQVNWDDKEWQALVDAICEDDDAPLRQAPELPPALGPLLEKIAAGAAPTQNRPEGSPEVPGEFQQPTEFEQLMSFLSLVLMWSIARFDDGLHVAPPACTLDAQALFAVCWRTKVNRSRKAPRKLVVPRVAIVEPAWLDEGFRVFMAHGDPNRDYFCEAPRFSESQFAGWSSTPIDYDDFRLVVQSIMPLWVLNFAPFYFPEWSEEFIRSLSHAVSLLTPHSFRTWIPTLGPVLDLDPARIKDHGQWKSSEMVQLYNRMRQLSSVRLFRSVSTQLRSAGPMLSWDSLAAALPPPPAADPAREGAQPAQAASESAAIAPLPIAAPQSPQVPSAPPSPSLLEPAAPDLLSESEHPEGLQPGSPEPAAPDEPQFQPVGSEAVSPAAASPWWVVADDHTTIRPSLSLVADTRDSLRGIMAANFGSPGGFSSDSPQASGLPSPDPPDHVAQRLALESDDGHSPAATALRVEGPAPGPPGQPTPRASSPRSESPCRPLSDRWASAGPPPTPEDLDDVSSIETRSSQASEAEPLPELPAVEFYLIPTRNLALHDADPESYSSHKFHAVHPQLEGRLACTDRQLNDLIAIEVDPDEFPRICKKCVAKHPPLREWFHLNSL